jgi:hypothetical protein
MSSTAATKGNESVNRINHQKANIALCYNIVGTMLPLIISLVLIFLFFFFSNLKQILDRGDLCIYSAGLYTSAIISFMNNKKELRIADKRLHHLSYLLIFISSLLFAGFSLYESIEINYKVKILFNVWIIRVLSIGLLGFSVFTLRNALEYEFINQIPETNALSDEQKRTSDLAEGL